VRGRLRESFQSDIQRELYFRGQKAICLLPL
jgi:hypothetical protein